MSQRPIDDAHGLSPREEDIIARLEAGASKSAVALEFGVSRATINVYASRYIVGAKQLDESASSMRAGDARYRAALAACGGTYR